jgi:HSP20 family protein
MSKALSQRQPSPVAQSPLRGLVPKAWFDELFDQFFTGDGNQVSDLMKVHMDVAETEQAFEIKMDLPGVSSKDIDIQVDNNTLTVRGQRTAESEEKNEKKQYHRVERYSGTFSRSIVLPLAVNEDEAAAEFRDGVLKIVIPKSENAKPRRINIKS